MAVKGQSGRWIKWVLIIGVLAAIIYYWTS